MAFDWHPLENGCPEQWASSWGCDTYGVYMGFAVGDVEYRLRWVPSGEYWVGSPEAEEGRDDDEQLHQVRLTAGYWIGETPVTQALWQEVMGNNPSEFQGKGNEYEQRPVEQVSWNDCAEFCRVLNKRVEGLMVDFPTEAQWEVACRAGDLSARYGELDAIAWHVGNSERETHPVGEKLPNRWGLYDMIGNVWEWCRDGMRTYGTELQTDPIGPTIDSGDRVIRGGAFVYSAGRCRAAYRDASHRGLHWHDQGFRLCRGQSAAERRQETSK